MHNIQFPGKDKHNTQIHKENYRNNKQMYSKNM